MKFASTVSLLTVLGAASAGVVAVNEEQGGGPMTFTDCGSPSDTAHVESISLSPNPPQMGKPVTVSVKGKLDKAIQPGAKLNLQIMAGALINIQKSFDACEVLSEQKQTGFDPVKCPILVSIGIPAFYITYHPDEKTWTATVMIPNVSIPPFIHTVNVKANVKNKDGSQVACQNVKWPIQ